MSATLIADALMAGSGLLAIVVFVTLVTIAGCWIIFPFIVVSKFNELLKVEREIARTLATLKTAHDETNKALQWIVDNEARK